MGLDNILSTIGDGLYSVKRWLAGTYHLYHDDQTNKAIAYRNENPTHGNADLEGRLTNFHLWREKAKDRAQGFANAVLTSAGYTALVWAGVNAFETAVEVASKFANVTQETVRLGAWFFVGYNWLSTSFQYGFRNSAIKQATREQELLVVCYREHVTQEDDKSPLPKDAQEYVTDLISRELEALRKEHAERAQAYQQEAETYRREAEESSRRAAMVQQHFDTSLEAYRSSRRRLARLESELVDSDSLLAARAQLEYGQDTFLFDEIPELVELDFSEPGAYSEQFWPDEPPAFPTCSPKTPRRRDLPSRKARPPTKTPYPGGARKHSIDQRGRRYYH